MNASKTAQNSPAEQNLETNQQSRFLYTEECGLALFLNQQNGRKFYLDSENWQDLNQGLKLGWKPA